MYELPWEVFGNANGSVAFAIPRRIDRESRPGSIGRAANRWPQSPSWMGFNGRRARSLGQFSIQRSEKLLVSPDTTLQQSVSRETRCSGLV